MCGQRCNDGVDELNAPSSSTQAVPGLRTGGTGTFSAFTSEGTRRNRAMWYWIATRPLVVRHGEPAGAAQVEHAEGSAGSHQRTVGGGQDSLA